MNNSIPQSIASCPPDNAFIPLDPTNVYRFVDIDFKNSFKSHYVIAVAAGENFEKKYKTNDAQCRACGLSVLPDLESCNLAINKIPTLRKKAIAVGNITAKGSLLKTPAKEQPMHHTWWWNQDSESVSNIFNRVK